MSLLLYLLAFLLFFLLFYLLGLRWDGSLVIAVLLAMTIVVIAFPGITNSTQGQGLIFLTSLVIVIFAVYHALGERRENSSNGI